MSDTDSNDDQNDAMSSGLKRDEKTILILREIGAHLYENRDYLINEWSNRISKFYSVDDESCASTNSATPAKIY